jgi:tetratricopeptide (TPR) repeat protein
MTGRQDLFEESMSLGHSAAWEMQWDRAIEFYRKALAEFPEDPTALSNLGLALLETDHLEEALIAYQKARESAPDNPIPAEKCAEIHEQMGDVRQAIEDRETAADLYVRQRNADKAIENWCQSARLDPDNLAIRSRLGLTYERLGRKREAAHEYLAVAAILQRNGKTDRAMEAAQMALRLQPADPEARSAMRALRQGRSLPPPSPPRERTGPLRREQLQDFLQSKQDPVRPQAQSEPDDPELAARKMALSMLAGMLFEESSEEQEEGEALELATMESMSDRLGQISRSSGRAKKLKALGQAIDLQTRGNVRQAAKEFQQAINAGVEHPAAHYVLGLLLKELHDFDAARQHLMVAVGHPELALGSNLALGRIHRTQGNLAEAARYLLQALRYADTLSVSEAQSAQLNELYDTILATQNEGDKEDLSRIVENTLNFLTGPEWLHRVRKAREQLDDQATGPSVVPIAEMLTVARTDRVVQALERIDDLVTKGLLVSAMEEALLGLEFAPNYLGLHLRIAEILLQSGKKDSGLTKLAAIAETHRVRGETIQATKIYTRMLHLSPVDINARRRLIDLLARQDRIEEALKQYLELADIYRQMAEIDSARRTLADALQQAEMSAVDRSWTVRILHGLGNIDLSRLDWRKALLVFEQINTLDPHDDDARFRVIDLHLRLGQDEEAARALDVYLQQLVDQSRGDRIVELLEDLAREYPGRQVLHRRLAEAYKAVGRKADAIAQYDALGEIQLDAGQVREAIRTIHTIIDLEPPDVEGYRQLLHNLESG